MFFYPYGQVSFNLTDEKIRCTSGVAIITYIIHFYEMSAQQGLETSIFMNCALLLIFGGSVSFYSILKYLDTLLKNSVHS